MAHELFISYRRSDSASAVGRLFDRLTVEFGRESVFKDVDSIGFGDFRKTIRDALHSCRVVLVAMGPEWATCVREDGTRRLDHPADAVRLEVEAALARVDETIVVPLLVEGASMPRPEQLPESIRELVYYNGFPIRHDPDFHGDVNRLVERLRQAEPELGSLVEGETASAPTPEAPSGQRRTSHRSRPAPRVPGQPRVFAMRIAPSQIDRMREALVNNQLIIGWAEAPELMNESLTRDDFVDIIHRIYCADEDNRRRAGTWAGNMWRFLREMDVGDLVVVPHHEIFYVARVTGPPTFNPAKSDEDTAYRRSCEWLNKEQPSPRSGVSEDLQRRLAGRLTLVEAPEVVDEVVELANMD